MATDVVKAFVETCNYLQDPRLVARFQRLCGVRGTFPEKASESQDDDGGGDDENSLTGDVGQEFLIHNKFLFYLFTFGTELGNEMFFIVFFPFLFWNVDALVSRRLIVVWAWNLMVGQSTKDMVRWSRPASPPVVKVEVFYNSEYSMPSTHAMTGTAIPFCLFMLTYGRWQYPFLFGLCVALCWSVLVCVSRVYMGMHSVLVTAAIIGPGFGWTAIAGKRIFCVCVRAAGSDQRLPVQPPRPGLLPANPGQDRRLLHEARLRAAGHHRVAREPGTGGVLAGLVEHLPRRHGPGAGHRGRRRSGHPRQLPAGPDGRPAAARALLRFALGVAVLLLTRMLMKAAAIPLLCRLAGLPADDVRRARQRMAVELPYRYIVYSVVGFTCVCVVPLLFRLLNLA
uniref:Sphingosine-1-phosphate phosphatase 1 n=1 Tax=Hippocampus comes TaxID=109280 RepID=A0A3Q2Y0P7_HIPCM